MEPNQNFGMIPRGGGGDIIDSSAVAMMAPSTTTIFTWEQAVRVLRKNRLFAIIFALMITLGVAGAAFMMKDIYQPTARLQIDPPDSGIKTMREIEYYSESDNQDYLETQSQVLQSDSLAMGVIRELHLDRNPAIVGAKAIKEYGNERETPISGTDAAIQDVSIKEQLDLAHRTHLESIALGVFQKQLSVNTVRNTRLIEVSYASHDPALAQQITNALVAEYIDSNYRSRYATTMQASQWLSAQLNDLRQKVQDSGQAVADYQKRYGFVEADDKDVPMSQLMAEINHQLSDAVANRIEVEAFVRMIDLGQSDAVPAVRDDQLYQNLVTRFVDARASLAQARSIYGDANSNVKKLEDEVTEIGAQVEVERNRMVNQVRTNYGAARAREDMMTASRERIRAQMGDASSHMVQYKILKNEALATADLYDTLLARLKEAGIYAGLRSDNIHIVDLAPKLRSATGPHRELIIGIGAMVASMLALCFAFVRESLNNTVRTPDDIKDWTGLSSLAMVPSIARNGNGRPRDALPSMNLRTSPLNDNGHRPLPKILLTRSHTAEAEAMRDLRTALMLSRPGMPPKVILVASSSAGEGKTTVAINLAVVFAQRGRTCLVDGDLRRPMVANAFGIRAAVGLSHVLTGTAPLEQCLTTIPDIPGLSLLPVGPLPPNPADLVASEQMRSLVMNLRQQFDHIIIDSPPAIPFSDARVFSSLVDVVILVGRYGLTTRRAITRCAQLLDEVRAPVVGVVVNGINIASADYHYYNYGYSKNFDGEPYKYYKNGSNSGPSSEPSTSNAKAEVKARAARA
jgi:capsular exopolysaccharide synthesis family protein